MIKDNVVRIELTRAEALVLDAFLARIGEEHGRDGFTHESEQRVLGNIEEVLEIELRSPLSPNYPLLIQQAREEVAAS